MHTSFFSTLTGCKGTVHRLRVRVKAEQFALLYGSLLRADKLKESDC